MGALDPSTYQRDKTLSARIGRRLVQWSAARPIQTMPSKGMVSFTFDDFAISAAELGAPILEEIGAKGTFYVCSALGGRTTPLGKMFTEQTLEQLLIAGHDIAAHSHAHIDCSVANLQTIQSDLTRNFAALRGFVAPDAPRHYAWPFGETRLEAKRHFAQQLATARGTLPGINRKGSDLMQLRAYALTPDEASVEQAERAIEKAADIGGWVILFTHDVSNAPTPLGTTPSALRYLAKLAQKAGTDILPMSEAYTRVA